MRTLNCAFKCSRLDYVNGHATTINRVRAESVTGFPPIFFFFNHSVMPLATANRRINRWVIEVNLL